MEHNIEIEFKYEILNNEQLETFCNNLALSEKKRVVDVYLDTQEGYLFTQGVFVRVRNNNKLDFKFDSSIFKEEGSTHQHEHCDEVSFTLPLPKTAVEHMNKLCKLFNLQEIDQASLEQFKERNQFVDFVIIDKERVTARVDSFEIAIDSVANLGDFMEIEALVPKEEDYETIKERMREVLAHLDVKLVDTGYVELFLRKHNFDLYVQGRYVLKEDK